MADVGRDDRSGAVSGLSNDTNTPSLNDYDLFLGAWNLGSERLMEDLDNAARQDKGGLVTMGAALVKFPAEVGLGLLDSGLYLGGLIASENVRQDFYNQAIKSLDEFKEMSMLLRDEGLMDGLLSGSGDIRFTVDSDILVINGKAIVGTDFYGAEFKNVTTANDKFKSSINRPSIKPSMSKDNMFRTGVDWEGNNVSAIIGGTNIKEFHIPLPKKMSNIFDISFNAGMRYNLTSSENRGALNFKFSTPKIDFSIDLRSPPTELDVDSLFDADPHDK